MDYKVLLGWYYSKCDCIIYSNNSCMLFFYINIFVLCIDIDGNGNDMQLNKTEDCIAVTQSLGVN